MASYNRLPPGRWRVQVRRNGHAVSRSFRLKEEAQTWAREQEDRIDEGRRDLVEALNFGSHVWNESHLVGRIVTLQNPDGVPQFRGLFLSAQCF